jgi:regulator of protease activity HflC (stomatin/prohibitin superfamily)
MRRLMCAACVAVLVSGCAYRSPEPGYEAVLVDYPWMWGDGGIRGEPINTGSYLGWSSTNAVYVNMQPIANDVNFQDMNSKDGVPVDFAAQMRLQVTDSVVLVRDFGVDFYGRNLAKPFESAARRAVNKHTEEAISTQPEVIAAIDAEVMDVIAREITELKIPVKLLSVTVGRANPPDAIKAQREATAAQRQRQQTEMQGKLAEDQRKAREASRAAADNAYREAMNLSPTQFIELERIKAWERMCGSSGKCVVGNIGQSVIQ